MNIEDLRNMFKEGKITVKEYKNEVMKIIMDYQKELLQPAEHMLQERKITIDEYTNKMVEVYTRTHEEFKDIYEELDKLMVNDPECIEEHSDMLNRLDLVLNVAAEKMKNINIELDKHIKEE